MGKLMHTNPTLQLIRLATHPPLTPISENTGFSENDLLTVEIINCVIVCFILLTSLMTTKLLIARERGFTCPCNLSVPQIDPVLTVEVEAVVKR